VQTLGGYAGTGKSTVIRALWDELPSYAVAAYTGKAASVLRRKGLKASTLHSLLYRPHEVVWTDDEGEVQRSVHWELKEPDEVECSGFLVDEASMVSEALYQDLLSFERPIIFVGDHGQLPPIEGCLNLMESPDITLETVHRNAGEIAHFAELLREDNFACDWRRDPRCTGERVRIIDGHAAKKNPATIDTQHIVAFNKTRVALNRAVRARLGRPLGRPVAGDRVICLQNDRARGLFNGMQGEVTQIDDHRLTFASGDVLVRVPYEPEAFDREKHISGRDPKGRIPFDYAYAITCHKAQGDEFDTARVHEARCPFWEHRRWAYTAASRARTYLTWVAS
jgi:exodeoxyribonuclease-5